MNFDIANFLRETSIAFVPFLFAITVHEASHGFAAYLLGDDTAKKMGRLTLNPIKHIDLFGLLFLLLTQMFGWAKPVPVDFRRISHVKYGPAIVAAAGPLSNLLIAILSVILVRSINGMQVENETAYNIILPIFMMLQYSVSVNIALAVFNLLPILPMDGGRILQNFLPLNLAYSYSKMERYGMFILLFLFVTGTIRPIIIPVIRFVTNLLYSI